jgi:hypothetical protein
MDRKYRLDTCLGVVVRNWVGGGLDAYIYHVTPTIVVKTVRCDRTPEEKIGEPYTCNIIEKDSRGV